MSTYYYFFEFLKEDSELKITEAIYPLQTKNPSRWEIAWIFGPLPPLIYNRNWWWDDEYYHESMEWSRDAWHCYPTIPSEFELLYYQNA